MSLESAYELGVFHAENLTIEQLREMRDYIAYRYGVEVSHQFVLGYNAE